VIKDRDEHVKFQMADFPMYPRLAVLDPDATRTLPSHIAQPRAWTP
jgi:alcohol dehydrogenase class IV